MSIFQEPRNLIPFEPTFNFFDTIEDHNYLTIQDAGFSDVSGMEAILKGVNFESSNAILQVFEKMGQYLEVNSKWALTLKKYVYNFITRKVGMHDHMPFFGAPYLGLEKITFTTADRNE